MIWTRESVKDRGREDGKGGRRGQLTARLHQMCVAFLKSNPSIQPPFTLTTFFPGVEWMTRVPQLLQK